MSGSRALLHTRTDGMCVCVVGCSRVRARVCERSSNTSDAALVLRTSQMTSGETDLWPFIPSLESQDDISLDFSRSDEMSPSLFPGNMSCDFHCQS